MRLPAIAPLILKSHSATKCAANLSPARRNILSILCLALICISQFSFAPAHAQIVTTVSAQNDDRVRGRSASRGKPVTAASATYEDSNGILAGGSISLTLDDNDNPDVLLYQGFVSYASNISQDISADIGIIVNSYTENYAGLDDDTFVEAFAGLSTEGISGHVRFSPDYLNVGTATLYLELDSALPLGNDFSATAHLGLLLGLDGNNSLGGTNHRYDTQIGIQKDFKRISVFTNIVVGGPREGVWFDGPWMGRTGVVGGISYSF